ncbi:MAG: hypothetical protein ABSF15_28240 [Candidatus Sulfotelmatobacter sp.]|jgi:hypothetical protein
MRRRPSDCVRAARASLRLSAQICGGADINELHRAFQLLETSVTEMRQADAEVRHGIPDDCAELRREIALLKREIAGTMRVADGCAALYRGASMRLGLTSLTYAPKGNSVAPPPSTGACELQG